jgi:hypothetical protein
LKSSHYRLLACFGLCLVFVPAALFRYIDGDEGYILYAARLVSEGQALYRDFFFPQAPLVPNVFAALYKLTAPSWYGARLLAAAFAAVSGYFVYELAQRYTRARHWGLVSAALYATCGYSIGWMPIAKTYGLAVLFSLAALVVLERGGRAAHVLGGFLIVMAAGARLYLCVIGLNAAIFSLRRERTGRARTLSLVQLGLGALLGLSLFVPPFLRDYETAFFGVFEFASMRFPEQTTLFGSVEQKLGVLLEELALRGQDGSGSVQLLGLVLLGTIALLCKDAMPNRLTAGIWPLLLFVNLLPYNTFSQYVCVVVPFVAVEASVALAAFLPRHALWRVLAPGLTIYALLGALDAVRFTRSGTLVIGLGAHPGDWRLSQVHNVAAQIDKYGKPEAMSFWPGYFVTTRTRVIPQFANHFAFHVTGRLDAERRKKLVLMSEQEVRAAFVNGRFPLVVIGNWVFIDWNAALGVRYQLDGNIGNAYFLHPR